MYTAAKIDVEKCTGCRLCILCCPEPNVLMLNDNKKILVNESRCKGCGLCVSACSKNAVSVQES